MHIWKTEFMFFATFVWFCADHVCDVCDPRITDAIHLMQSLCTVFYAGMSDAMPTGGMSFWNFNRTIADYTPLLRKYLYQSASRSAQANKLKDEDIDDGAASGRGDEVHPLVLIGLIATTHG